MSDAPTGSDTGSDVWLEIGVVLRPHGVRGAVVVKTHNPRSGSLVVGKRVRLSLGGATTERKIRSVSGGGSSGLRVGLVGVVDRAEAEALQGATLSLRRDDLPAPEEGEFYHHQLIGLAVRDRAGVEVGRLTAIYEIPAHDVYVVRLLDGSEVEVPAVGAYVGEIDVAAGFVVMEGLDRLA